MLVRLRLIGDVVFTTPVIRAVKRRFPAARLTYLVEAASAPVVRHNPHIDDLVIVARPRGWRRLRYDWNLARRLRRQRFDVAIDLHGGPRAAWLTRGSAAPVRIGYDLPGRRWAYTARIAWTASLFPFRPAVAILAATFVDHLAVDHLFASRSGLPPWYLKMRRALTAAVVLAMVAAFAAPA